MVAAGSKPSNPRPLAASLLPWMFQGLSIKHGNVDMAVSHRAEGRGLAVGSGRFWGAHSLRMTPRKRVQVRGGGSSWPQSSGGSAVLVLCLHSGDGAVKSRLLQKGTGHSQTREQWKNKFVIVTPESIKQTGSDLQKNTAPGFCPGGCFMVGKEGLRSVQAFFFLYFQNKKYLCLVL